MILAAPGPAPTGLCDTLESVSSKRVAPDVLITDDEPAESPAERFARSRDRANHPHLAEFAAQRPFVLDRFQTDSCRALEEGRGVLVCAPTGAGKTVVG